MPEDSPIARLTDHLARYRASGDAVMLLDEGAVQVADELLDGGVIELTAEVRQLLGSFYGLRLQVVSDADWYADLARALVVLRPLASDVNAVPAGLRRVLGPRAWSLVQRETGRKLLGLAHVRTDEFLLRAAIELFEALRAVYRRKRSRAIVLGCLCAAYRLRFERTGGSADLDLAMAVGVEALRLLPARDGEQAGYLANLAMVCLARHQRDRQLVDLDHAVELADRAVQVPGQKPSALLSSQGVLAMSLLRRFSATAEPVDLARAIEINEALAEMPSLAGSARAEVLNNLGASYRYLYQFAGDMEALNRSVALVTEALELLPAGHPVVLVGRQNLVGSRRLLFELTGDPQHRDEALSQARQALAAQSNGPQQGILLGELSMIHKGDYELTGHVQDLEEAITSGVAAVDQIPEGHTERSAALACLGNAYWRRYDREHVSDDLERAISLITTALSDTPERHPGRAALWSNLSAVHLTRFERFHRADDLDQAIHCADQAVAITTEQPTRANYLSNRGLAYFARFGVSGRQEDLDEAIGAADAALEAVPRNDRDHRPQMLTNLTLMLRTRFEGDPGSGAGSRALTLASEALAAAPSGHTMRARMITSLAGVHLAHAQVGASVVTGEIMDMLVTEAGATGACPPSDVVNAQFEVGRLAQALDMHETAVSLLDSAVSLLPSLPPRQTALTDQAYTLGNHAGLVGSAVAAHLDLDDTAGGLRVAELGRGVILAAQLNLDVEVSNLEREHSELAQRYRAIRDQLNKPVPAAHSADARAQQWREHDIVLADIRRTTPLRHFPMPTELPAPVGGIAVLVNVSARRGDAILIDPTGTPRHIPLPGLTADAVQHHLIQLITATNEPSSSGHSLTNVLRKQRLLPPVLEWLWTAVVEPILDELPPGPEGRRVWWLPTGLLGLFPLHAATPPNAPGALEAVVSSYATGLRALAQLRTRPAPMARRQLIVAMPITPGEADLTATLAEVEQLHAQHPGLPPLIGVKATADSVLAALPRANWTHFACHAHTDLAACVQGALLLQDGPLPIPTISALRLDTAELAYLSACATAALSVEHGDEPLHLAAAFQLAGYRHVVASFWPLPDRIAATAAHDFYTAQSDSPSASHAAAAINAVARKLRETEPLRPDIWANMVHHGP
ncbi:MAG TPA: CHAT domain-containing tetratricopeptide repeat protein [Pseudonocardiaceae bacterium]|nr:CHAT domain-containing tetratricopeptide repeat protein [Pseudonocardiaceae bacterium]